jgi:hypothetical protein
MADTPVMVQQDGSCHGRLVTSYGSGSLRPSVWSSGSGEPAAPRRLWQVSADLVGLTIGS